MSPESAEYRFSLETTSPVVKQLKVEVDPSAYSKRFESSVARTARKVSLKGFRPGKVPAAVVKKMYGPSIREEVLSEFFREAFDAAVKEHHLHVLGVQSIDIDEEKESAGPAVRAELAILPEPEIKDYFGVKTEVEIEELKPNEVEERLEMLREMRAPLKDTQGREVAEDGDVATISFVLKVNGEEIQGVKSDNEVLRLGKGRFLREMEDGIIGMKVGETKDIDAKLPDDFIRKEFAGKMGTFAVTLKEIKVFELPELNDEFATQTGYGDTVEELRRRIEEESKQAVETRNRDRKIAKILAKVVEENEFAVPQLMIDNEIRQMLAQEGFIDPRTTDLQKVDVTPFRELLASEGETRVRRGIVLQQIEKQEKLEVTDDETKEFLRKRLIGHMPAKGSKPIEEILGANMEKTLKDSRMRSGALREKTLDMLIERAKLKEKPLEVA